MDKHEKMMDEGLQGNEKIEQAIAALQKQPSEELLVHALTVIRRRMQEHGQWIVAVEPAALQTQMNLQMIQTADGRKWCQAYTSFEEEMQGADQLKSTFLADISKLFEMVLQVEDVDGVILNPWNRTMMLDKHFIQIIRGKC